jgi:hypothetical protein
MDASSALRPVAFSIRKISMRGYVPLFIRFMTSPALVLWTLPWLMLLLVMGTISQRYIGLYASKKLFFSAWWIWLGPVPVPGVYMLLGVLTAGLMAKLLFKTNWKLSQSGIILTHIGALLLLAGGLMTAITSEEGYIILGKDEVAGSVSDYHQRELVIQKNGGLLHAIPHQQLHNGMQIQPEGMPFVLNLQTYCLHCEPYPRTDATNDHHGVARKIRLKKGLLQKEDEENFTGVEFIVSGAGKQQDGLYLVYEPVPDQPEIKAGGDVYRVLIRKQKRALPFKVRLEEFQIFRYPGTDTAREYQSDVTIMEETGLQWQASIRMNEPLRTHGYALYQSSFIEEKNETLTVLAVVKNHGFFFPYIASIVMAVGLLLHMRLRHRMVRQ